MDKLLSAFYESNAFFLFRCVIMLDDEEKLEQGKTDEVKVNANSVSDNDNLDTETLNFT